MGNFEVFPETVSPTTTTAGSPKAAGLEATFLRLWEAKKKAL
jgi:hypothetical protein